MNFQVKGRIYVFGGNDCSYTRAEAYYYTVSSNSWTQISNVPWGGSLDIISPPTRIGTFCLFSWVFQ